MSVTFGHSTPILRVSSMAAARSHYVDRLGFQQDWGDDGFAAFRRGEAVVMLACGDQGAGRAWLYIGVDDVDALHDEIVARGAPIRLGPSNYPWGARELHVEDADGNIVRFGSDATDEPIGEWLDETGRKWRYGPDESWHPAD